MLKRLVLIFCFINCCNASSIGHYLSSQVNNNIKLLSINIPYISINNVLVCSNINSFQHINPKMIRLKQNRCLHDTSYYLRDTSHVLLSYYTNFVKSPIQLNIKLPIQLNIKPTTQLNIKSTTQLNIYNKSSKPNNLIQQILAQQPNMNKQSPEQESHTNKPIHPVINEVNQFGSIAKSELYKKLFGAIYDYMKNIFISSKNYK